MLRATVPCSRQRAGSAARREIALLPEVAAIESDARELRLTAMPKPGANVLSAVGAIIAKFDWDVPELHLESGRLDEVFRALTEPNQARSGIEASAAEFGA